jgi:hypothetical protein
MDANYARIEARAQAFEEEGQPCSRIHHERGNPDELGRGRVSRLYGVGAPLARRQGARSLVVRAGLQGPATMARPEELKRRARRFSRETQPHRSVKRPKPTRSDDDAA